MATITDILDKHKKALLDFERYRAEELRPFTSDPTSADQERLRAVTTARLQSERDQLLNFHYLELSKEAMSLEVAAVLNERLQEQEMERMFAHHEQHTWTQEAAKETSQETAQEPEPPKPADKLRPLTPAERMKAILNKGKEQDRDQDQER